ncbi:hypothetical protein EJB14_00985 [Bacillus pumilus]|nr:hypothetical protein EJB14_00985 [Bacillus pumilus]
MSGLRAGAHECSIRSAPVLALPRLQRFSITLKRRQRAKINIILALCQQSKTDSIRIGLFVAYQMRSPHKMYKLFVCKG